MEELESVPESAVMVVVCPAAAAAPPDFVVVFTWVTATDEESALKATADAAGLHARRRDDGARAEDRERRERGACGSE